MLCSSKWQTFHRASTQLGRRKEAGDMPIASLKVAALSRGLEHAQLLSQPPDDFGRAMGQEELGLTCSTKLGTTRWNSVLRYPKPFSMVAARAARLHVRPHPH